MMDLLWSFIIYKILSQFGVKFEKQQFNISDEKIPQIAESISRNIIIICYDWHHRYVNRMFHLVGNIVKSKENTSDKNKVITAIKAYQLVVIVSAIVKYSYLRATQAPSLYDILFKEAGGGQYDEVYDFYVKYSNTSVDDLEMQLAIDIAKYMTESNDLNIINHNSRFIALIVPMLTWKTREIAARCFSDKETIEGAVKNIREVDALLTDFFDDLEISNSNRKAVNAANNESIRILVVGKKGLVECNKIILETKGWYVQCALNAKEAIGILDQDKFDVIICEPNLYGMSGIELLKITRQKYPYTQFIMVTGYYTEEGRISVKSMGAFDYVAMPYSMEQLQDLVEKAASISKKQLE